MKHPLIQLILAHIKEFFREPGSVFWSFGFPILMALGLGAAFSGNKEIVHNVALVPSYQIEDTIISSTFFYNETPYDTVIEKKFESGFGKTKYIIHVTSWDNGELLLKRGIVSIILSEINNEIVFHADPLNPESELIGMQLSKFFKTGSIGTFEGKFQILDTKGLRYIDFLVPGLISVSIMMSVMWGVCYTLIERRSKKLLRRMVATPMKKSHLLISQWISRILVTFFEVTVLLLFSYYSFHMVVQGSLFTLILLLLAGNFCFFGLSILISSRTSNLQLGNGLISLITSPMMVLSGIFFSYQNFPEWAIKIIKILPLTMLVDEARSVINEGAGIFQVYDGILILSGLGIISFIAGLKIYKWY
ncbi:MAG: ABC transporter permease [Bacteroidales bacterium]|nr:ABC transporter permease [Bacteroidales bacterium]